MREAAWHGADGSMMAAVLEGAIAALVAPAASSVRSWHPVCFARFDTPPTCATDPKLHSRRML